MVYYRFIRTIKTNDKIVKLYSVVFASSKEKARSKILEDAKKGRPRRAPFDSNVPPEEIIKLSFIRLSANIDDLVQHKEIKEVHRTIYKNSNVQFKKIKCEFCDELISKNGAAQFSHLKKHLGGNTEGLKTIKEIRRRLNGRKSS